MERSTVLVEGHEPTPLHGPRLDRAALLTLRRGVSAWASWGFDDADIGTTISVGAWSGCDWQVAAPGTAPLAIQFTGESLLVRSLRPAPGARLNGAALWSGGWVPLEQGDVLELGASAIHVTWLRGARQQPRQAIPVGQNLVEGALSPRPPPSPRAALRHALVALTVAVSYVGWVWWLDSF